MAACTTAKGGNVTHKDTSATLWHFLMLALVFTFISYSSSVSLSVLKDFQKLSWFSLFIDSNHLYSLEECVRRSHIHVDISIIVYYMIDIGCISFDLVDITDLSLTGWYNFPPFVHALLQSKTSQKEWQGTHVFSAVYLMDSETFLTPSG